jgi:hypothetical protein
MTGNDVIASAARVINYLASGETLPNADATDALRVLNQMLSAWSTKKKVVFTLTRSVFNLIANQQTYTYGTGGDFNAARPPEISYASIISNANPAQPVELPCPIWTDKAWQEIRVKNTATTLPLGLYDDGGFPMRNISFWAIPTSSLTQVAFYAWTALSQFADLMTDYTFPPGYDEAIKYNLARRLAAEWPGTVFSADARMLAMESLATIKSANPDLPKLRCDEALTGKGGNYNWLIDQPQ